MVSPRLEFALERVGPSDWRQFEKFASEFLVDDFPNIRTTASISGDRGRDGELFRMDGAPRTLLQYSVTGNWKTKVKETLTTIAANFPDANRLIYCTNIEIGAQIDSLRETAWTTHGIQLDLRDKHWFIEREMTSPTRSLASEELIEMFVSPLLQQRSIVQHITTPLSHDESRVAILQLTLNESDRHTDQSLTKTSFDALVLGALVDTSAELTKTRDEIAASVSNMLPAADGIQTGALARSALDRLSRKHGPVKHVRTSKRYHLSHSASLEWQGGAANFLLEQEELERDLAAALFGLNDDLDDDPKELLSEASRLRIGLERLLFQHGEKFARSIITETTPDISPIELSEMLASYELRLSIPSVQASNVLLTVLATPSDRSKNYLERILDAYTLLAFLQQTPDVQKTLTRLFDGAEIWLDTTAALPLIGEMAQTAEDPRPFTRLFRAAVESGLSLYVTRGVVEEIRHHLDNCLRYLQLGSEWRGRVPYVFSAYIYSGQPESELSAWITNIRGDLRPEEDIEETLQEEFNIRRKDLHELSDGAPIELRGAVQTLWMESHSRRRRVEALAGHVVDKLVAHDVENVVGVIELRRRTKASPLGYNAWWLTLDRTATKLPSWLRDQLGPSAPHSPAINPDYFAQMLRFGPLRRSGTGDVPKLPLSAEIRRFENIPPELLAIARETRTKYDGYGERRIRREVRDALDRARIATAQARLTFDEELVSEEDGA